MDIRTIVKAYEPEIMRWYQHLHQHPELSYEEHQTTAYIVKELEAMGAFTLSRPLETGVIADISCGKPGKRVAVRADIDALQTPEQSTVAFPSKVPGKMHACGHDGHMTMLLAVAKFLADHKEELTGSYRLLFQPAEEIPPGGAVGFIKAGALEGVDYIIGQHVMSLFPTGQFGMTDGAIMAASDIVEITVIGKEGHASQPHFNIDVVTCGAQIVTDLQHIVSREIDPLESAVVSMTNFHAGTAHNVMPREAHLVGSIRTFSPAVREYMAKRIPEIVKAIAAAHRCEVEVEYKYDYGATINDKDVANFVRGVFADTFGEEALPEIRPVMGGEDFSYYLNEIPGVFYFLGIRNDERGYVHPIHHSAFRIDPPALLVGAEAMIRGALALSTYEK